MSQSLRAELASLLKRAAEQRKRIKDLQDDLERLYMRMGRVRAHTADGPTLKAGPSQRKTTRKK